MVWGATVGAALSALQRDVDSESAIAWTLAGLGFGGLVWYVGREHWRRHQGPGLDFPPHIELGLGGNAVDTPMPPGPGWTVRNRSRSYGTPRTIAGVRAALQRYYDVRPQGPRIAVWDISRRGGGEFPPHVSHQTGRDVDVKTPGWPNVNCAATWALIRAFDQDPKVKVIFFSRTLQECVAQAADDIGEGALAKQLLQVRGGRLVRHWAGHRSHLHVRFEQ